MLYKRSGTPYWWVRFRVRGVEVRRSTGTKDKRAAEDFEHKLREDAWRQTKLGIVRRTWTEATERWLTERAAKRSIDRDREAFAAVAEYLASGALDELTRESLAKLRQVLEDGRKPATVLRLLSAIRAVLKACVTWGWLNEAPPMTMPKVERTETPLITRKDFEKIVKELPWHQQSLARFSVETGQRFSSVVNLKWSVVDLKRKHAFIGISLSKSKRPISVPLNSAAMEVLKGQVGRHGVYVFTDHKGRAPVGSVKTGWLKAVKRAGFPGFRWHDLRHTWASWHTMNGTPPIVLKELGGWASLAMVERYSHLSSGHLAHWAEAGTKTGSAKPGRSLKSPNL